ncbi:MAG: LapA family protein, partial [Alphaproteobacteria bacterium]|nr:LapA family protein [Alphaproteobacteria bacterium]
MKRLRWLITVPLALILIVFAVNNRHLVDVSLWPLGIVISLPLFVF